MVVEYTDMNDSVMEKSSSADVKKISEPSLIWYAAIALGVAIFVRVFVAAPYIVSGASMEPTFNHLDYLITDRISYRFHEPMRGDIVIFDMPGSGKALIKRLVGLPGETVRIADGTVSIVNKEHPEGFILTEEYLDPGKLGGVAYTVQTLKEDEYFVLGDNRAVSADSRIWGALPKKNIVGRVLVRLFPFQKIEIFPGVVRYDE